MLITAEFVEKYEFVAYNNPYVMGNYFGEDDWSIKAEADSMEELFEAATKKLADTDIDITNWYVNRVKVITYDNSVYKTEIGEFCLNDVHPYFLQRVQADPEYLRLRIERSLKIQAEKAEEAERAQHAERSKRQVLFEQLKKEFDSGS